MNAWFVKGSGFKGVSLCATYKGVVSRAGVFRRVRLSPSGNGFLKGFLVGVYKHCFY